MSSLGLDNPVNRKGWTYSSRMRKFEIVATERYAVLNGRVYRLIQHCLIGKKILGGSKPDAEQLDSSASF